MRRETFSGSIQHVHVVDGIQTLQKSEFRHLTWSGISIRRASLHHTRFNFSDSFWMYQKEKKGEVVAIIFPKKKKKKEELWHRTAVFAVDAANSISASNAKKSFRTGDAVKSWFTGDLPFVSIFFIVIFHIFYTKLTFTGKGTAECRVWAPDSLNRTWWQVGTWVMNAENCSRLA